MRPVPAYRMELTLLAPTVLSAVCSKALAFWAAAGPSARADTATNVTSRFLILLLQGKVPDSGLAYHKPARSAASLRGWTLAPLRHEAYGSLFGHAIAGHPSEAAMRFTNYSRFGWACIGVFAVGVLAAAGW